jgi:signal transduction histidine kinase
MKIFTQGILAKKKVVFIFLLAILLPSIVVGYLSFSTFARRRESVRRILESNLWVSGEAALLSFESALFDLEKEALEPQKFSHMLQQENLVQPVFIDFFEANYPTGRRFLLDEDLQIVFPKTGNESVLFQEKETSLQDERFAKDIREAEFIEHTRKNYARAAGLFRRCAQNARSKPQQAKSLEGLGRCLMASNKNEEAFTIYSELATDFGQFLNAAGHPYGVTAAFQLHEIRQRQQKEKESLKVLLDAYRGIREGRWLLNLAAHDFFVLEIEAIFEERLDNGRFPDLYKSWREIQEQPSPYLKALLFSDFLSRDVIPTLEERLKLTRLTEEGQASRFIVTQKENFCLISYAALPGLQPGKDFIGGYSWDLDALRKTKIPRILEGMMKDTGLTFQIVEENKRDASMTPNAQLSSNAVTLSLRQFPLPWKFIVSQPELVNLERTAVRETLLYGLLLGVIVVLMIMGAILIVRDISRETETTRLKTEFVHNISHELKTPLTLIRLYGETLQRKDNLTEEERKESYEIITKESERLSHLINNVLDFSRIDMGRKEFNFTKGSLSRVAQETLDSYRYHLAKNGFVVKEEIDADLPDMNFDREAIASVLVNLLSNVMKFSPSEKEVKIRLFRGNGQAVLQVADKGIGISPQDRSRIFKRFYRAKNDVVSETKGSGLGLTLVKHITEAHGGTVEVESEPGKGSIFSIILPISGPE